MVVWDTYRYTYISDENDRKAWYETKGLDDYFDITLNADSISGKDVFVTKNTATNKITLTFTDMTSSYKRLKTVSGSGLSLDTTSSGGSSQLNFSKLVLGDIVLWKIENTNASMPHILIAFDTKANFFYNDTTVTAMYACCGNAEFISNPAEYTFVMGDGYRGVSSGGDSYYRSAYNDGYSTYSIQPMIEKATKTNFYTLDGGVTKVGIFTDLLIGGQEFYTLGHGIAIKVS